MKNQEREGCGLCLGLSFYSSGTETVAVLKLAEDSLALIRAGAAQNPNKPIINVTKSSFHLTLSPTPTHPAYVGMPLKSPFHFPK